MYCRSRGFVYLMAVLLALGASARANGTSDSLFEASRIGDITTLKALLGQSVDVDSRSADGYAALAVAAEPGREDVVDLLLAAGADPNTTTLSGGSAISIALKNNHLGVVASLLAAGADGRVLHQSPLRGILLNDLRTLTDDLAVFFVPERTSRVNDYIYRLNGRAGSLCEYLPPSLTRPRSSFTNTETRYCIGRQVNTTEQIVDKPDPHLISLSAIIYCWSPPCHSVLQPNVGLFF